MNQRLTFNIGRNDLESSKTLEIEFPLRGLKLQRLIESNVPLFVPEDEYGLTTNDSNVYSAVPFFGAQFQHRIMLLTGRFNDLDERITHKVQIVDESDIMSQIHLRPSDYPRCQPTKLTVDKSTQTEFDYPGSNIFRTNIDNPSPPTNGNEDLFDLPVHPVISPLIGNFMILLTQPSMNYFSVHDMLASFRNEPIMIRPLAMMSFDESRICSRHIQNFKHRWLNVHSESDRTAIQNGLDHSCVLGPCFYNWCLFIAASGYEFDSLLLGTMSYVLYILNEFYFNGKVLKFKEFTEFYGTLSFIASTKTQLTSFIEEAPLETHSNGDFYQKVRTKYFGLHPDVKGTAYEFEANASNGDAQVPALQARLQTTFHQPAQLPHQQMVNEQETYSLHGNNRINHRRLSDYRRTRRETINLA